MSILEMFQRAIGVFEGENVTVDLDVKLSQRDIQRLVVEARAASIYPRTERIPGDAEFQLRVGRSIVRVFPMLDAQGKVI